MQEHITYSTNKTTVQNQVEVTSLGPTTPAEFSTQISALAQWLREDKEIVLHQRTRTAIILTLGSSDAGDFITKHTQG